MSRQLEKLAEDRQALRSKRIILAVEFGLEEGVRLSGGVFLGFSIRCDGGEALMVLKAQIEGERQVSFIGAEDLGACLIKAEREARRGNLKWREDKWNGES